MDLNKKSRFSPGVTDFWNHKHQVNIDIYILRTNIALSPNIIHLKDNSSLIIGTRVHQKCTAVKALIGMVLSELIKACCETEDTGCLLKLTQSISVFLIKTLLKPREIHSFSTLN